MDARAKTVREILHSGDQYLIPFFQRYYSWKRRHWERLRDDLGALLDDPDANSEHFLGPLVCTPLGHVPGEVPAYQLIDGQQRLTTLTLLLTALRDVAREQGLDDLAEEVTEDYLIHKRKKELQRYKVVPRVGDREALIALVESKVEKEHRKFGVYRAWQFFRKSLAEWIDSDAETKLRNLFVAVTGRLSLVVITIDGENPYEIFESLNSTGLPLEESDLIRNYIFMQVPTAEQEDFNVAHWEALESMFEAKSGFPEISATQFYRSYLMRAGEYSKSKVTFVDFKEQNRRRGIKPAQQVDELRRFAKYEHMLRRPQECDDEALRSAFGQIAMLDISTAHPLLMNLLDRHEAEEIDQETLLGCLADLSSFVLRRSVCGESSRSYGRWFVEAICAIKDDVREDLRKYWIRRGWPDDSAFVARLQEFPLYRRERKKCRLILLALEQSYGHKEKVDTTTLTIEHVMPQKIKSGKSGKAWQAMLGEDWRSDHENHVHTIGNLTLTGYNPDMSNRPFSDKQVELVRSNLILNRAFEGADAWNAQAISSRGKTLAEEVAAQWPRPEGADYVPPAAPRVGRMTTAEKRQLYSEYWSDLLSVLKERGVPLKLPNPAPRNRIGFRLERSFRLIAVADITKQRIAVGLRCLGNLAKAHFSQLRESKSAIESEISSDLLWQELPQQKTSLILLRKSGVSPEEREDWPEQHAWLAEQLETFHDVFSKHCAAIVPAEPDVENRKTRRKRFWSRLLEIASERTDLHAGISAGIYSWIGTGVGIRGLGYHYVVVKNRATVELYIDRGKGNKAENKKLFDELLQKKDEIESNFGGQLDWERLDAKRACRIAHRMPGGYRNDESEWPTIQQEMVDAMIRLEKALSLHIPDLKKLLNTSE